MSSLNLRSDWVVMTNKLHCSIEIGHILANEEASVSAMDFFIMDESVASTSNGISCPSAIFGITQVINITDEHGCWYFDIVDEDERWILLAVFSKVFFLSRILIKSKLMVSGTLSIVQQTLE